MPLRFLGFAAALLLVTPGCDLVSSDLLDNISSSDRTELEGLTGDFFECNADVRSIRDRATGTLESGDCLQTDDSYQDFYAFRLTERARVDIDVTSRDFAPYLFLLEADLDSSDPLNEIDRDRNTELTDRARVSVDLEAGLYLIYVNSVDPNGEGDYMLSVDAATYRSQGRPAAQARTASGAKV